MPSFWQILITTECTWWFVFAGFVISFQTACDHEVATGQQPFVEQFMSYLKPDFPF